MTGPHVLLDELSVRFGTQVGLRNVSLSLAAGERVALLGPSGVGKSSLLRTIAGLDAPAAGRVIVATRDVTALDPRDRGVVYLHQRPLLFPHMTVVDNVAFPLTVRGVSATAARERAHALLAQVQLTDVATRASTALSGGQQHRVALARALAADPALLLLDEPFAALDPSLRVEVRDAVQRVLGARGLTTMLVTHDVDEAVRFADRIAVMLDAQVVQIATPAELLARPTTVQIARFLGLPNVLPAAPFADLLARGAVGIATPGDGADRRWLVARASAFTVSGAAQHDGIVGRVVGRLDSVDGTRWQVMVADQVVTAVAQPGTHPELGGEVRLLMDCSQVHLVATDERGTR